jgi:hypothetical protein
VLIVLIRTPAVTALRNWLPARVAGHRKRRGPQRDNAIPADVNQRRRWLKRAVDRNSAEAMYLLADLLERSKPAQPGEARRLRERADKRRSES